MEISLLNESGYEMALAGIGLSYGIVKPPFKYDLSIARMGLTHGLVSPSLLATLSPEVNEKLKNIALKLSKESGGEDKFLRQIQVWFGIRAPLGWFKQLDTYKVGTTAQSESTMHTLHKNEIKADNFEDPSKFLKNTIIPHLEELRKEYVYSHDKKSWRILINTLPESWLQYRIWNANYAVLKNILTKRQDHKLIEWHIFCRYVKEHVFHPELLPELVETPKDNRIARGKVST